MRIPLFYVPECVDELMSCRKLVRFSMVEKNLSGVCIWKRLVKCMKFGSSIPTIQNLQHTLRIPSSIAELLGFTQARALGETFHKLVGMTCWFSLFQDPGHMLHVYIATLILYI